MKLPIILAGLLLSLIIIIFIPSSVSAKTADSCDLCGWCRVDESPTQGKPADWNSCMQCLFPSTDRNDTSNNGKPQINTYYPSNPEKPQQWTVFGCLDTGAGGFVSQIYQLIISFGAGFAFLAIVYGGFKVLTAGGDPTQVSAGKHIIMGAISGILLIVFSVFLLKLIGVEIIKLPGFG